MKEFWKNKASKKRRFLALTLVVSLFLLALASLVMQAGPVVASPPAAIPTPLAEVAGGQDWAMVTLMSADTVSGTETGNAQQIAAYTAADIQYDLGFTSSETVTCKLQFSNNNSTWDDGMNIAAAKSADATGLDQFNLYGRYVRAVCTPTGTATFTATITAKVFN